MGHCPQRLVKDSLFPYLAPTLRHSFATEKIAKTGKIKGVSEYLGHSSSSITLDMYVHEELTDDELDV